MYLDNNLVCPLSGLVGPLVICKKGYLQTNGVPKGYDKERFIYFAVMDENKSWYLDKNMDAYCTTKKCNGISKGKHTGSAVRWYF